MSLAPTWPWPWTLASRRASPFGPNSNWFAATWQSACVSDRLLRHESVTNSSLRRVSPGKDRKEQVSDRADTLVKSFHGRLALTATSSKHLVHRPAPLVGLPQILLGLGQIASQDVQAGMAHQAL